MSTILAFENVTATYEGYQRPAISNVSFTLSRGERVALLGLNGSGKTTLLKVIAGLVPFTGSVTFDGQISGRSTINSIRSRLGFVFAKPEDQILFPKVVDDVAFGLRSRGFDKTKAHEIAIQNLVSLGIGDLAEADVYSLSHGAMQRVALAGALAFKPDLLLLDEPTSDLDPVGRTRLADSLAQLPAAILMASHDTDFSKATCQRFLVFHEGRIVADLRERDLPERWWDSL